jgi:hypothetical protein
VSIHVASAAAVGAERAPIIIVASGEPDAEWAQPSSAAVAFVFRKNLGNQ